METLLFNYDYEKCVMMGILIITMVVVSHVSQKYAEMETFKLMKNVMMEIP